MEGMSGMNPDELEARAHLEQQAYQNNQNGHGNGVGYNNEMETDAHDFDDYDEEDFHGGRGANPHGVAGTSSTRSAALMYGAGGGGHSVSSSFRM